MRLYRALRGCSCGSLGFLEDRMMDIITGIFFLQGATSSTRIKGLKDCDGTENWKYRGLKLFFSCRGVLISPSGPQVALVLPVILVGGEPSAKRAPTLTILGLYFWLIKVSDGGDQKKATVAPTSSRQWPPSTDTHWARRSRVAPWNIMLREMICYTGCCAVVRRQSDFYSFPLPFFC